jgi:endonuclease YncB( thermonuclease family)
MRGQRYILLGILALGAVFCSLSSAENVAPRAGIVVPCEIVEWHDGDTGTVRVTVDIRVRLLDCWAPETKGRKLTDSEKKLTKAEQLAIVNAINAEKQRGLESLKSVSQIAPIGSRGYLEIPFAGVERSDDLFTLGRLLGRVWINGNDVSRSQVESGHAKAVK